MKTSDFIFRFKSFRMRHDSLCRVRFFINTQFKTTCVLTDIGDMANGPYLESVCDTVIIFLNAEGHLLHCDNLILHDEYDNSMKILNNNGKIVGSLSREELKELTECNEEEFIKKSMDLSGVRERIIRKRSEIDPFLGKKCAKDPFYYKREIEIQENAISKATLKKLIDDGAGERELGKILKMDLSLVAEIYSQHHDEYIVFSEFPLGGNIVDFAVFSGRSTMDVTFIEIKGADFNLKKRSHYDAVNAKIEEANSQIRSHRKYIYSNYEAFRKEMHIIRSKAENGEKIHNAFLSPVRELQVDPEKNVNIDFVIVAGRTPEHDVKESDIRYQYTKEIPDLELLSWDSWIKRLRRD